MDCRPSRRSFLVAAGLAAALRGLAAAGLPLAGPADAAPVRYSLDAARSTVRFEADFGPDRITGEMPVGAADLTLDFADVTRSRVAVRLDADASGRRCNRASAVGSSPASEATGCSRSGAPSCPAAPP